MFNLLSYFPVAKKNWPPEHAITEKDLKNTRAETMMNVVSQSNKEDVPLKDQAHYYPTVVLLSSVLLHSI